MPHRRDGWSVVGGVESPMHSEAHRFISCKIFKNFRGFQVGGHVDSINVGEIAGEKVHPNPETPVVRVGAEQPEIEVVPVA